MHYPSTVEISDATGEAIANYVNLNSVQVVQDDGERRRLRSGQDRR
jgi:hypothetical protein